MKNIIAKKQIDFGKINYNGTGKRYPASVTIELRKCGGENTPEYLELSICGDVWNTKHTDIVMGGQCIDSMAQFIKTPLFRRIRKLWKRYHLNGMHAGTPEQERAIEEWKSAGNKYDYTAACEYLKSINLYEVPFYGKTTGKVWNWELYKYGHGWIIEELPETIIDEIMEIINAA